MESRARKHRLREPTGEGEMFRNKKIKMEKPNGEVVDVSSYHVTAADTRDTNQNFR
jgi:hypothetical protein